MVSSERLCLMDGDVLSSEEATQYRSIVGGLQYLTMTPPDLSFVVNKVCQYLPEPRTSHWSAVKRILCYACHTIDTGLQLRCNNSENCNPFLLIKVPNFGPNKTFSFIFHVCMYSLL
jgi:hypothetical protein